MIPIYKIGEHCDPQNYHLISLTCKILEHVTSYRLMKHVENNNLLYEYQNGFRHNRSCETQLVSFINDLAQSYDNSKKTDVIFMDIAKAFDTVPQTQVTVVWYCW